MSQLVTSCPHCSTSFHVNQQQLHAARGSVRCGSCLQVFSADEHIELNKNDPQPVTNKVLETLLGDDDFLIHDNLDLDSNDLDTRYGDGSGSQSPVKNTRNTLPGSVPVGHSAPGEIEHSLHHRHVEKEAPAIEDNGSAVLSSEAAELQPFRHQLISAIEPTSLEVSGRPQPKRRLMTWLWVLLALLLLSALVVQAASFHFDSLSKREPWRQLYAAVCPYLNCRLPPQVDLTKIHTSNLLVRSHPQRAGTLIVEAVLLNRAPFSQPFPALQLSFTDLKNLPVASRRFRPRDYLHGEMAGREQMPKGNPVRIVIDIVDPGRAAVNYELLIAL